MIRSGWVIGSALVVGSVSIAQPVFTLPENGAPPSTVPSGGGNVLWDQTDNGAGHGVADQAFESLYAAYDSEFADDFVVTDGEAWDVTGMFLIGSHTSDGAVEFGRIRFYADNTGLPAEAPIPGCSYENVTDFVDDAGSITYRFAPCGLTPGHYWISQQVRQDLLIGGQHFWSVRTEPQIGHENVWRNPGNGFGLGCTDWTPYCSCSPDAGCDPDARFQLLGSGGGNGSGGGDDGNQIPTIGPLGIGAIVLGLGLAAAYVLRRRN